jgi:hypothetical protein
LFDDSLRKLLDRETLLLVTHQVFSEIEPESIFEMETTGETARINEIGLKVEALDDDINSTRQKEEIVYTERFYISVELFRWWPEHRVTYPPHLRQIPISSWKDVTERGTRRIGVYGEGQPEFPVIVFQADLWIPCRGKVDFYAKSSDIPATKSQLERQERWRYILVRERESLIEISRGQKQEVEERKANLFIIARAHKQVPSMMNSTRRGQINEYEQLVIRLWSSSASRPSGIRQVDDFLFALREYRRFAEDNLKLRPLTIGDISRLASYARAWLARNHR